MIDRNIQPAIRYALNSNKGSRYIDYKPFLLFSAGFGVMKADIDAKKAKPRTVTSDRYHQRNCLHP